MGGCGSEPLTEEQKQERKQNELVNTDLTKAKAVDKKTHKLLLLGTGNSGKSTFFKQLCRIHKKDMTRDKNNNARYIHDSIIHQMQNILHSAVEINHYQIDEKYKESFEKISNLSRDTAITPDVAKHMKILWGIKEIKDTFTNRKSLQIVDSCPYFFENIERIGSEDYDPTEEDLLKARIPTSGILEQSFPIKNNIFNIYDVGGQRSERNKWIHCFDCVSAIIYVASLSCYDQMLYEDEQKNALTESLNLFKEVTTCRYFRKTSFILFLNKRDLFEEKVKQVSLKVYSNDYPYEEYNYTDGIRYIKELYFSMHREDEELSSDNNSSSNGDDNNISKKLFSHVTCAIDRNNVDKIFDDVQNHIVQVSLEQNGLM